MRKLHFFFFCIYYSFTCPFNAHAQIETPEQLLQRIQSSLVEIRVIDTKTFNENNGHARTGTFQAEGSGIIISSDGLIVTNTHIINSAGKIFVGLYDGTKLEAKAVYSSEADFSFIKVDPPRPLDTITWADSSLAQEGTPVIALSNTDADHQQILGGIITKLIPGAASNNIELLELNLDLFPGDSGGPLLDNQGHLLGMIMAKRLSEADKTYAIASNKIQEEYSHYQQNIPN